MNQNWLALLGYILALQSSVRVRYQFQSSLVKDSKDFLFFANWGSWGMSFIERLVWDIRFCDKTFLVSYDRFIILPGGSVAVMFWFHCRRARVGLHCDLKLETETSLSLQPLNKTRDGQTHVNLGLYKEHPDYPIR